jgi:hypothetical protein
MSMTHKGNPRCEQLDNSENLALTVAAMHLSPKLKLHHDDIGLHNVRLQH